MVRPRQFSGRLLDWFSDRTGAGELWGRWMGRKVPGRLHWGYSLGALALFLILAQCVSGILIGAFYIPAPEAAHDSVRHLEQAVRAGRWLRSMHQWGAGFLILALLAHMTRTLVSGAFKAPRELNWISGVCLFLLVLAFCFTGALLPWDQDGYWGTVVGTRIAGLLPWLGPMIQWVLRGGGDVGALTLSRFYLAHILLLPFLLFLLVMAHLVLQRRHGPAHAAGSSLAEESFYPRYAARDMALSACLLSVLAAVAWLWPATLGPEADPMVSGTNPRPAWYFLAFYQLLKYLPGRLERIAAVGLPLAIAAFSLALPFLVRSGPGERRARVVVNTAAGLLLAAYGVLTILGAMSARTEVLEPRLGEVAGAYFFQEHCASCHSLADLQASPPDFWLRRHARDQRVSLAPGERSSLAAARSLSFFLRWRSEPDLTAVQLRGSALYVLHGCSECHSLFGGGGPGADLSRTGLRRDRPWLVEHFRNPAALSPGSTMPPLPFTPTEDLEAMSEFLLTFR